MLGAIIGDTVGSVYEWHNVKSKDFPLFKDKSFLTDDSIMTLAIGEIIENNLYKDKDKVIDILKKWGTTYKHRGYGGHFYSWLNSDNREPYNSFGNGSAMRVSACGSFGKTEEEVKEMAKSVTEVTHNHPFGLIGAEVTALCIYYAKIGKSKEFIKEYASKYYNLNFDYQDLVDNYIFDVTCQGTVPEAIYCFLISKDFEDCIRTAISMGGDSDTLTCIACSIAEAYYKDIPKFMIEEIYKRLPNSENGCNPKEVLDKYIESRPYLNK